MNSKRSKRKLPYPRNSDIKKAILRVFFKNPLVTPDEFPYEVLRELEEMSFYTGLVNIKRIWRTYETMVRKGEIYDILDVVIEKRKNKTFFNP